MKERWMRAGTRWLIALQVVVLALAMQFGVRTAAAADPNQGPGGPILVITSPTSTFSKYYAEILRAEGLNSFAVANDINTVTSAQLATYDVVILAQTALTGAQVTMLSDWVNAGGNLIAMDPDPALGGLLGLTPTGNSLPRGYLLVDSQTPAGAGITAQTMQFQGAAQQNTLSGASAVATLYSTASAATAFPAVSLRSVGSNGGQAAAFAFDLARSIVLMRQGNPAWAGQDRDGAAPVRSDDMFFGAAAEDPQPDWIDRSKVSIPQADEQQRLLANLIIEMNRDRKPLPRFWYFPRGLRAVVVMTGDDHANNGTQGRFDQFLARSTPGCNVANWECIRGTSYLYPSTPMAPAQALSYAAAGFEVGVHINTGCSDYTPETLPGIYTQEIADFKNAFPGLPPLVTQRHHCVVWSDWATGAKVQFANGMRLDTNYYYWPPGFANNTPGHFTGSAMPMRFADTDGTLIDVYQAVTQMTDESGQAYPFTIDTLLDRALGAEQQFGVYTINAHTDEATIPESDAVLDSAIARGVPIISAQQMLTWLDGRNASTFGAINWNGSALTFTVTQGGGANGLQGMLPRRSASGVLATLTREGASVTFQTVVIKGIEYATFTALAGAYAATYAGDTQAPTVGARTPASGATGVNPSSTVTAVFNEALDPTTVNTLTFELRNASNVLVPATVAWNNATLTATLTPASPLVSGTTYTATLRGGASEPRVKDVSGNALAANVAWSFTVGSADGCPCTIWPATATPSVAAASDPSGVELGVKFRSDVNGYITGIRFYKGAGNTGTHTGSLWSSAGQLLATATFTNETATGWQQVNFSTPVAITANTVYVASYFAPGGNYAINSGYFASAGTDRAMLHALGDGTSGGNGVYRYGSTSGFPSNSWQASNYWVDVVFVSSVGPDTTAPTVAITSPTNGSTFTTGASPLTLGGTAADNVGVTQVTWTSSAGGSGTATGTTAWTATGIALQTGANVITVTARDAAGNTATATLTATYAPDTTAPTVTGRIPAVGGTNVSVSGNISATFSELMDPATVNAATFELRNPANVLVASTVTLNPGGQTAVLTPSAPLAASTTYTATVRGGATGMKDLAGNPLAANVVWSFTTGSDGCPCTIWPSTAVPGTAAASDTGAVELGVKFRSDVSGFITGIRFYKGTGNGGTHIGNLWSSSGQLLATATFTNETATGWQQVNFSTPVAITANTVYVASYFAPVGRYAINSGYFASAGTDRAMLHALQDGVSGGNGVYRYGSTSGFPSNTWQSSNYWVDVVFVSSVGPDTTVPTVAITSPTNASTFSTGASTLTLGGTAADNVGVTQVSWTNSAGGSGTATGTSSWTATGIVLQPGANAITVTARDAANNTATASLNVTYTPDTTAPTVTGRIPAVGATNVSVAGNVSVTFSELMDPATVSGATFELRNASNVLVAATVSLNPSGQTAVLTPSAPLTASTTYTATVRGGATGVKDLAGNPLAANVAWSFTTGAGACAANAITAENCLVGNPASEWDVSGAGDPTIQGFATDISVNRGGTVFFKVKTDASNYRFDVYRMGYYAGLGARKVATVQPTATLPQNQPNCLTEAASGLIDCGNWAVSGSWSVPANATSGIYFAKVVRTDTGGASHIMFIVRDDASTSDIVFQTSDTTWQAYNNYGGNSLYTGGPGANPGRAYKVSYNRPFATRAVDNGQDWVFNAEYPMVRWLEANGYNVSYISGIDTDRLGATLLNHRTFMSVGHDEYWSGNQRANVEAARNAGVNLAFFSGNEIYWKTRWENSIDGSAVPYRTLVSYKETHANAKIDPSAQWTGTWRDPRFSPPSDGGKPENALTGTLFMVNDGATTAITVPAADGKMRFWRNTSIASLTTGQTATLPTGTLGYEWDVDADNGFRPAGAFRLSTTTVNGAPVLQDFGSTFGSGTATHSLMLYRHSSRALVFGAGTVQWSWGLDATHDRAGTPVDVRMQQATLNLLADMGAQPASRQAGLVAATASTDVTAPVSLVNSPIAGASIPLGVPFTITGTASDSGGVVGGVEISVDGGTTWRRAEGRENWTFAWTPATLGSVVIRTRAVDDSGNIEVPSIGTGVTVVNVAVTCPCTIWPSSAVPASPSDSDTVPVEIGVKFRSTTAGFITGIRFYKGTGNTGTHIANLWTSTGTRLATATFTNETASGWQQVNFASPVPITANTVYVASYFAPNGRYAGDNNFFSGTGVDRGPLRALQDGESGGNGVYAYGAASSFPSSTWQASNYWVDVVFTQ